MSSLRADMSLRPEWLIAKWSTALSVKHHTKIRIFFFLFWPGHRQKIAFIKRARNGEYATLRFSSVCFYRCHPGDHRVTMQRYLRGRGGGQGEIVCEG